MTQGEGKPFRFRVHGTGLSKDGSAHSFCPFAKISEAKAYAIEIASLDATQCDRRALGNTVVEVGSRVSVRPAFPFEARQGTVVALNSGNLCTIHWDGYARPTPAWLAFLEPVAVAA